MTPESRQIFDRLMRLAKEGEEAIRADPFPHIENLARENAKLRGAIEQAILALKGADDFDLIKGYAPDMEISRMSMVETCLMRNRKAEGLLREVIK